MDALTQFNLDETVDTHLTTHTYGIASENDFKITLDLASYSFSVGLGNAVDAKGRPIRITTLKNYDPTAPSRVDSQRIPQPIPASTGSVGIPIINVDNQLVDTYVLIRHLYEVDTDYEEQWNSSLEEIHGYSIHTDGYEVITTTLDNVGRYIGDEENPALFIGLITKHRSVLPAANGFKRKYSVPLQAHVQAGDAHSHTAYALWLKAYTYGITEGDHPAETKVIIEDVASNTQQEFTVEQKTGWQDVKIDLSPWMEREIRIYLASRGDYQSACFTKWDNVVLARSTSKYDGSVDVYPLNYSFDQFESTGSLPTVADVTGVSGVIDSWSRADINDGAGYGWSGVAADATSGYSEFVLQTCSPLDHPELWGCVRLDVPVLVPKTYFIDFEFAIPDGSITGKKFKDRSIPGIKLELQAVTSEELADGAVITDKIADRNVTAIKIAENAIGNEHIADNSISGEKIMDYSIPESKLGFTFQIPGNVPQWITRTLEFTLFRDETAIKSVPFITIASGTVVSATVIKPEVSFTGTRITDVTISLGYAGNESALATGYSVHQPIGSETQQLSSVASLPNWDVTVDIYATCQVYGGVYTSALVVGTATVGLLLSNVKGNALVVGS